MFGVCVLLLSFEWEHLIFIRFHMHTFIIENSNIFLSVFCFLSLFIIYFIFLLECLFLVLIFFMHSALPALHRFHPLSLTQANAKCRRWMHFAVSIFLFLFLLCFLSLPHDGDRIAIAIFIAFHFDWRIGHLAFDIDNALYANNDID